MSPAEEVYIRARVKELEDFVETVGSKISGVAANRADARTWGGPTILGEDCHVSDNFLAHIGNVALSLVPKRERIKTLKGKKVLRLHVKAEYFFAIKSGEKELEYRECSDHWLKRLFSRDYDYIVIALGYPKKDDQSKRLTFKYRGYDGRKITHPHFNNTPTEVFAISVKQADLVEIGEK